MKRWFVVWALLLAGVYCLTQKSAAFWQSRDSNYNVAAGAAYTGPADVVASPLAAYSCTFAASASYAAANGKLCNIQRASDSHTCDILAATTGGIGLTGNCSTGGDNGQTVASFLNATTGTIQKAYEQTATNPDLAAGTAPALKTSGCLGSLICMGFASASSQYLHASGFSTAAQPVTASLVYEIPNSTTQVIAASYNATTGINLSNVGGANCFDLGAPTHFHSCTATDAAWHTAAGVFNGASSVIKIDAASPVTGNPGTAGLATGCFALGANLNGSCVIAGQPFNGLLGEIVMWGSALNSTQLAALHSNQCGRWGTTCLLWLFAIAIGRRRRSVG